MKKLKIAIIGCGRISAKYKSVFQQLADQLQVCFAVDCVLEKAQAFAADFPDCTALTDYHELLVLAKTDASLDSVQKEPLLDVVHLCLPHRLHTTAAIDFLDAGIHVLTEKPIAITLQDADLMIEASRKNRKLLGVIFQTRYVHGVLELRKMIQENRFGKILSASSTLIWSRPDSYYEGSNWKGTWEKEGGGVLIDQAIHSIDRVRFLLDSEVEWIEGSVHNHCHPRILVEDTAEAAIRFQNGVIYNLYACNSHAINSPITIEIVGEKGRCGMIQDMGFYEIDGNYTEIRTAYDKVDVGPNYWGSTHRIQVEEFYQAVRENHDTAINGEEGRKTLEIIKGIYLSSATAAPVTLPFRDCRYLGLNQPE